MFLFGLSLTFALLALSFAAPATQRIGTGGGGITNEDLQKREIPSITRLTRDQATWALARISSGPLPLVAKDSQSRNFVYNYDPRMQGNGTMAFIISTGCEVDDPELQNRGQNVAFYPPHGGEPTDVQGYGTGLAQIIGGKSFGVASEASLGCIKVGRDDQPYPEIKDIADAIRGAVDIAGALNVPAVIVLGWVTDLSQVLDDAVSNALAKGIPVISGAGIYTGGEIGGPGSINPARIPGVICVGATDIGDNMASDSNLGPAVTLFAPGVDAIPSEFEGLLPQSLVAASYVAGVALNLMSTDGRQWSPDEIKHLLLAYAFPNVVKGIPANSKTPNLLLSTGFAP